MKLDVKTLDGGTAGSVDLPETIFGLAPRPDLVQRMVLWQLALTAKPSLTLRQ